MQKSENGLQCIVTGAAQKGMYFPWDSGTVCAVLTAGFCLLLAEAFPSVPYPWWAWPAAALLVQAVLFAVYQSDIGNWGRSCRDRTAASAESGAEQVDTARLPHPGK